MMEATLGQWSRLMGAGWEMAQTGFRFGEMMLAANHVVGDRVEKIEAAAKNPLTADYSELGRMVPEKVEAFSKAGSNVIAEMCALQQDMAAHMQQVCALMLGGRVPTITELSTLATRSAEHATRMMVRSMGVGGVALAPIHARATSNARRLKQVKRRP